MAVQIGDQIPDCPFLRLDGTAARLSEFQAQALVLIFLRHLAWLACRAHLGEVQQQYDTIRQLGGDLLVVSFTSPDKLAPYVQRHTFPFPVVADPTRAAYQAFQLRRGSWWMFLRGQVVGRYLKLMMRGWLPKKTSQGDDLLQLGGDFVLDGQRRLVYAYASVDATDRPPAQELVQAVRQAVGTRWRKRPCPWGRPGDPTYRSAIRVDSTSQQIMVVNNFLGKGSEGELQLPKDAGSATGNLSI